MTYAAQAVLAQNPDFLVRVAACAATEGIPNPYGWAYENAWTLSAQPGWAAAWASAIDNPAIPTATIPTSPAVISDGMILGGVQAVRSAQVLEQSLRDQIEALLARIAELEELSTLPAPEETPEPTDPDLP